MGFFKKIGKAIKKNVNLKNVLKVATPLMGAIPIVGGFVQTTAQNLQDAHAQKKAQEDYDNQVEAQNKQILAEQAKQAASALVQGTAQTFSEAIVNGAYNGVSTGAKLGTAKMAVSLSDLTITEWLKVHWLKVVLGLSAFFGIIYLMLPGKNSKTRGRNLGRIHHNGRTY